MSPLEHNIMWSSIWRLHRAINGEPVWSI